MDKLLLEILACPICKGELDYNQGNQELICRFDRVAYPVMQNTPIMLTSKARRMGMDEND